jgi:hypothetical protein
MQANYSQTSFDFSIHDGLAATASTLNHVQDGDPELGNREVIVDPIRLADHGDISNSYSADLINNGRIRKPFRYDGQLYTTTSTISGMYPDSIRKAEAYRLVLVTLFDGPITDFRTKIDRDNGSSARSDPNGFYHGIPITYQSQHYVLTGPALNFLPNLPRT